MIGTNNFAHRKLKNDFFEKAEGMISSATSLKPPFITKESELDIRGTIVFIEEKGAIVHFDEDVTVTGDVTFLPAYIRNLEDAKAYISTCARIFKRGHTRGANSVRESLSSILEIEEEN
ncbi:hypothetical protein [Vibrio crassostreae]|uniref:hypothetical protein n=1 Tax=Vibrio crassostreae TaxID=246167 RepID=UPI001B30E661|nr:hypothetical protein [Vibrio crassostreae]